MNKMDTCHVVDQLSAEEDIPVGVQLPNSARKELDPG